MKSKPKPKSVKRSGDDVLETYEYWQRLFYAGQVFLVYMPSRWHRIVKVRSVGMCEGCLKEIPSGHFAYMYRNTYGVGGFGNPPVYWCIKCSIKRGWLERAEA